jgi:chemotaxis protein CheD
MELLINAIMNQGGDRRRLVAKVFGAANVLPALQSPTAGELNATFVRDFLATERIPLVAQRLGGKHAVQVHFRTDTGKTIVHSVDGSRLPAILRAEAYRCDYAKAGSSGDIDLFWMRLEVVQMHPPYIVLTVDDTSRIGQLLT